MQYLLFLGGIPRKRFLLKQNLKKNINQGKLKLIKVPFIKSLLYPIYSTNFSNLMFYASIIFYSVLSNNILLMICT